MKKFFSIFFSLLLFFFFFSFEISAQQKTERWVCLNAQQGSGGHTAAVSVKPDSKPLPNSPTYIFECLGGSCTSGSTKTDTEVFGKDNLSELQGSLGYAFQGYTLAGNPVKSDSGGKIPNFEWTSATPQSHARRWLALNYFEPPPPPPQGSEGGQQQGTFEFEMLVDSGNCVSLAWDPYGRVFDSKTLEPVSGVRVELQKKRADETFTMMSPADLLGGNIINPQITKEDGGFSFVVPDATYKLVVNKTGYTFPGIAANLNADYAKTYSDIYPAMTGAEIVQQGKIQHRDIPLDGKTTGISSSPKLMEYFYDLNKLAFKVIVNGRVSHPFASINAYSVKPDPNKPGTLTRYRLLTPKAVTADKFGKFRLELSTAKFGPAEVFGEIDVRKASPTPKSTTWLLRFLTGLVKDVGAQEADSSTVASFEPILNYLEGYAYDEIGMTLPNAVVGVYFTFSQKPSYTTKTDEKGYFKISSEFLPTMPYRLVYTSAAGTKTTVNLSKFLSQNTQSVEQSAVNVNGYKNREGKVMSSSESEKKDSPAAITSSQISETKRSPAPIQSLTTSSNLLLIIAVLLALILASLVMIGVYLLKNKQQPPLVPPTV